MHETTETPQHLDKKPHASTENKERPEQIINRAEQMMRALARQMATSNQESESTIFSND